MRGMNARTVDKRLIRILDDALTACCRDLFHAYGMELEAQVVHDASPHHDLGAAIGFGGEQIKGSLVLFTTSQVAIHVYPIANSADQSMLLDWVAELANQLVGRMKLRLLPEGIELSLSTPVALSGERLGRSAPRADLSRKAVLAGPAGQVQLWLDVVVTPGFELCDPQSRPTVDAPIEEGALLLF